MKKNALPELAVIGGGASGLAAAVFAAKMALGKIRITVYEANPRIGKKLLVTGNGRCNFSNLNMDSSHFNGDAVLAENALKLFSTNDTLEFFKDGGVFYRADNAGRIYPLSNQASSVLDFFREETLLSGVYIETQFPVTEISVKNGGFLINGCKTADAVIVACGGKAAPVHGSNGEFFSVLKKLGISVTPLYPALTPICIDGFTKALKGIRAEGTITIRQGGKTIASDRGELQFTEYGISGIPAMQVSGKTATVLSEKTPVFAYVDCAPSVSAEELKEFILRSLNTRPEKPAEMLLSGIMPKRLSVYLLAELSFKADKPIKTINPGAVNKIVASVKNKKYKISGIKGFADAQVTSGGVPASELNANTLELKKIKNMFVCGEAVNVDGECGGYNLQWAWSSAYTAADAAVKELLYAQNK